MTTSGLRRALRYFVRQAEWYVLYSVIGGFAMAAYMALINGMDMDASQILETVPNASVYIAMILLFINGISSSQYWYSIPISFGCLRKNAFWGYLVMDFLLIVEMLIYYFITLQLFCTGDKGFEIVIGFAAFLLLEGVSKFMGIASIKWGKAAYVVMIVIVIVFSVLFGFIIGYAGVSGMRLSFVAFFGESIVRNVQWITLCIGTVLCIAMNVASWRVLRRFEVKV